MMLVRKTLLPIDMAAWRGRFVGLAALILLPAEPAIAQAGPAEADRGAPERFRLTASRSLDGIVALNGVAPNGTSRQRFLRAAGLAPPTDGGDIDAWLAGLDGIRLDPASGEADWPATAYRALRAFSLLEAGRLSIAGEAVSLEGRAQDAAALDRIDALLAPDWFAAVWVDPEPPGLTLELSPRGRLRAEGILPPGLERGVLADALPGLSLPGSGDGVIADAAEADLSLAPDVAPLPKAAPAGSRIAEAAEPFEQRAASVATPAESAVWRAVLEALPIALPRMATGRITLAPRSIAIEGRLRRGFSAADTRAALRSALRSATGAPGISPAAGESGTEPDDPELAIANAPDGAWLIRLDLTDAPPPARLTIAFADGAVSLAGILPEGFDADTALVRSGGALRAGLTSGGAGDPFLWRGIVDALGALRGAFAAVEGTVTGERIDLTGTLLPGYDPADVRTFLETRLTDRGPVPDLELSLTAAPSSEGTERVNLLSGSRERFANGAWTAIAEPLSPNDIPNGAAADQ
ncbi:MAG: hypothetical protein AAFP17_16700 [Pseudomonadota bacterium]